APDVVGVPARLEPDVHMDAPVARRLRVADDPELVEERPHVGCRRANVGEVRAGLGVEVEPQLVGVLGVGGAVGPDLEPEAAHARGAVPAPAGAREVGPSGGPTTVVPSQWGADFGPRFWKKFEPLAPSGKRCMSVGRPPIVRITGSANRR